LAESASALTLATGHIDIDFKWNLIFTFIFLITVSITANIGINATATGILIIYLISHPLYLIWVYKRTFASTDTSGANITIENSSNEGAHAH